MLYISIPNDCHYVVRKLSKKRRGIGSALLATIENGMRDAGIQVARVHKGEPRSQWFESYEFSPKHGYSTCVPRYMMKEL